MSFFLCAVKTEFMSIFRNRRSLALLLLLPVCLLLLSAVMPAEELLPAVPVGWAMEDDCEYGKELYGLIRQEEGFVEFIPADEATLRANVASGKWACGFVLRDDFDRRVEKSRWNGLFTLVHGGNEALPSLVSEAVSSAMMVMVAENIGRDYLEENGVDPPEDGWILSEELRLDIVPISEGEAGLPEVYRGFGKNLIKGAAGILLLLLSISMGESLSRRRKSPEFMRMAAVRGKAVLLAAAIAGRFVLLYAAAFISLLVCGVRAALPLGAMCICMAGLMAFLSFLPHGYSVSLLPFIVPALLILCPVLFDVSLLIPQLKLLTDTIPVTHFIRGEVLPNLVLAAVFAGAAAMLNRTEK